MDLSIKVTVITGYLAAGFVSYMATNAVFEAKSGAEVLSPHGYLGLYVVDAVMGLIGAAVNYAIASICHLYRESNHDLSALAAIHHPPETDSH